MCFSAGASFGASAVLSVAGVLTLRKTETRSQYLFAGFPLLFALQQFTEGFVWLSLSYPNFAFLQNLSVYLFLIFAQIIWPVWVPLSVLLLEQKPKRKAALYILTFAGGIVSAFFTYYQMNYHPIAQIISCHIHYELILPLSNYWFSDIFYIIPTVLPFFISSRRRIWVFGIAIIISYAVTQKFYSDYALSVWCFFAAILSVIIYYTISKINEGAHSEKIREWNKN